MRIIGASLVFGAVALLAVVHTTPSAKAKPAQPETSYPSGAPDGAARNPDGPTAASPAGSARGSAASRARGLLPGCTVSRDNQPSCDTPAGWTLAAAQGFDGGKLPPTQTLTGAALECTFAHTGHCAAEGRYTGGDQQIQWTLNGRTIDSLTTYVSWWEYDDPEGKLNQDFFLARRWPGINDSASGAELQFAPPGSDGCLFNCTDGQLYFESHGTGWSVYQNHTTPGWGSWTQWEMYMSINPKGRPSGSVTLWRNGVRALSFTNRDIAGSHAGWMGSNLSVGGVYTYLVWWMDSAHTRCASRHSHYTTNYGDWSKPDPCRNQAPPAGYGIPFKRYFDDIIVLKK